VKVLSLTSSSELFDDDDGPCIWDEEKLDWVTRSECLFEGPAFISCKTVLDRTYDVEDGLLRSFFTSILGICSCGVDDVLLELDQRREGPDYDMTLATTTDMYHYIHLNVRGDDEWERIRYVTRST
jgi:hypothetical protein